MATRFRFYGLANQGALLSPAIVADWGNTATFSGFVFSRTNVMKAARLYTPNVARATSVVSMAAGVNAIHWQFISDPIIATIISGTIKGQILAQQTQASTNACVQFRAYVVSGDGATVRGVLVGVDNSALTSEFAVGTWTNRKIPRGWAGAGAAVSSVNVQDGDRIVFEIGCRVTPPDNTNHNSAQTALGAPVAPASDLPEDETTTDTATLLNFNSWVEISHDVVFMAMKGEAAITEGAIQNDLQRHGVALPRDPFGGVPTRGLETGQGGGDTADFIQQRIFDTVVGWCYYVKTFRDPLPAPTDTQPNHTNNLAPASHQLIGIRVKD